MTYYKNKTDGRYQQYSEIQRNYNELKANTTESWGTFDEFLKEYYEEQEEIELTDYDVGYLEDAIREIARLKGITLPDESNMTLDAFHGDIITATQEYLMALAREMKK